MQAIFSCETLPLSEWVLSGVTHRPCATENDCGHMGQVRDREPGGGSSENHCDSTHVR